MTGAGTKDPVPGREAFLRQPGLVLAAGFAIALGAAWTMGAAYDQLNQEDPQEASARWTLGASLFLATLGLAFAALLLGKAAGWLVLAGLAGILFLGDALETLWSRWGMDWDGGETMLPPVFVGFLLFAIGLVGLRRNLGARRASRAVGFPVAFFATPVALFAFSTLRRFSDVASDAEANWTSEHGDPSLGAVAVAAALVVAAVAWRRRAAK